MADSQSTVDLPKIEPLELRYSLIDPAGARVGDHDLVNRLAGIVQRASGFTYHEGSVNGRTEKGGAQASVDFGAQVLFVSYVSMQRAADGDMYGETMRINVPFEVTHDDHELRVRLSPPEIATVGVKNLWPFPYPHLPPATAIAADYQRIWARLKTEEVRMLGQVAGEIEAKYSPEAVFGNFQRMWPSGARPLPMNGRFVAGQEFWLRRIVNGATCRISITIYPYHDGSKVSYSALIPYTLKPDGSPAGSAEFEEIQGSMRAIVQN